MRRVPSSADVRLDGDGQRRAHRLAQLAGDAALLAVRIAAQRMQAAEARRLRRLLLGIVDGDLAARRSTRGSPACPCSSSQRANVLMMLRMASLTMLQGPILQVRQHAFDRDPDDGHRNEHLPAQPHDLVVAVAREGGAEPEETEQEDEIFRNSQWKPSPSAAPAGHVRSGAIAGR